MKLLLEISDSDIGVGSPERFDKPYRLRKASRAIIFNDKNEIAIQFASKYNYHKLPGGGLDKGENTPEALRREIKEEVGLEYQDELRLISAQDILKSSDKHVVRLTFVGEIDGEPKINDEHLEAKRFSAEEIKKLSKDELDSYLHELIKQKVINL